MSGKGFIVVDSGLDALEDGTIDGNSAKYEKAFEDIFKKISETNPDAENLYDAGRLKLIVIDSAQVIRDAKAKQEAGDKRDLAILMGEARNEQFLAKVKEAIGREWSPNLGVGDRILEAYTHSYGAITAFCGALADKNNVIFPKGSYLSAVKVIEPFAGDIVAEYQKNNPMQSFEYDGGQYEALFDSQLPKSIEGWKTLLKEYTGLDPNLMFAQFGYAAVKEIYQRAGIDTSPESVHCASLMGHGLNLLPNPNTEHPERYQIMVDFFARNFNNTDAANRFMVEQNSIMNKAAMLGIQARGVAYDRRYAALGAAVLGGAFALHMMMNSRGDAVSSLDAKCGSVPKLSLN